MAAVLERLRSLLPSAARARNSAYESAAVSRRTLNWHAPTASPNNAVLYGLTTMRDRSRAAARNDGYAGGALDRLTSNIVGTGIKPQSLAPDAEWRALAHALWLRWTDESADDGLLDAYGQQAQATRGWMEAGECFVRLRHRLPSDGLSVPLQLQVLEPELCPHTHTTRAPSGNRIKAGIEFDRIGRRVAYYFHPAVPGELQDYDPGRLVRVRADVVVHLYDPTRPGQLRGVPRLHASLIRLFEIDKFEDAVLLRHQLQNMFMAFLERPTDVSGVEGVNPLTGEVIDRDGQDRPMLAMEPGTFNELEPGEKVDFSKPPDMQAGYVEFMRQQLLGACAAHGVPYEVLTGDMSKVNDRTVRVILQEFRRRVQMWQHQIVGFQLCRRVWREWVSAAILSGALPMPADYLTNREAWLAVAWQPQSWPYLHPVQDVQAAVAEIRGGLTSRAAKVAERGEDVEAVDAQQAADNARADELGLTYDSDGRQQASATPLPADEPPAPQPAGATA